MKPPDAIRRELVAQWLARAEEDFGVAQQLLSDRVAYYAAIGFHAQQAAEKYLKAFLVAHQVDFPKTHDLGRLLDLVASVDAALADSLSGAVQLTDYGVDARYPGDLPELRVGDAERAFTLAVQVRGEITRRLESTP